LGEEIGKELEKRKFVSMQENRRREINWQTKKKDLFNGLPHVY
jgi:hypothetical protein